MDIINKIKQIKNPTLILENRNFDRYGLIVNYTDFRYKENLNSPNEIYFTVNKLTDSEKNNLWNEIKDLKIIFVPELNQKFEISVSDNIQNATTKSVSCTSLAESELSQILLRNIEINTDIDFQNSLYDVNFPTVFYRDINNIDKYNDIWESEEKYTVYNEDGTVNTEKTQALRKNILRTSSLLHRIMEKANNYTISHVDETLIECNWIRSFSIDKEYIYDVLVGDIATEFGVLFQFDSINRTVSAYDIYNTCKECGYRGDYEDICPKCGSTELYGQYGEDTTIFVSADALASQLSKTGDPSSVKTCFYIEGGDELMTAAVAALNPSGNSYIYNFSQDMIEEMPDEMVERIENYQSEYNYYMNEKEYSLTEEYVDDYNTIVKWLDTYYDKVKYPAITNPLVGYVATSELYYNLIDIESVLQTSLLPTITIQNPTLEESLDLIEHMLEYESESGVIAEGTIAVNDPESCMPPSPAPDNAVLNMVKATINTSLYKPEIVESTYGMFEGLYKWIGEIKLTSLEVGEGEIPETGSREYTFNVSGDVETYMKQQIKKNMARVDITEILDLTSLDEKTLTDEWMEWFVEELHYYSADALMQLQIEFRTCQQIILDLQEKLDKSLGTIYGDPSKHFYDIYTERLELIDSELNKRNSDIGKLYRLYEYNYQTNIADGELIRLRTEVNNLLNFQKYLEGSEGQENYWNTFCAYLREDTYSNENYISDGLDNVELIQRAKELFETAQQEILKSSNNQYTISTTLNNLLAIPKFEPLIEYFKIGNWIRVEFEDKIYKLRLLSYQINYEDLTNLDVEFSTVIYSSVSSSDIRSILDSAKKISGSYNAVVKQMNETTETVKNTSEKVDDGINSTDTPIVNNNLTQNIIIDKNGILGRAYDDIEDKYDDCQFRFVNNCLYMTNDNWKTVYNSIGKFTYEDEGEEKTAYGIKTDTLVGNIILSKYLGVKNENGTLTFDNNGLHVENINKTVSVRIDPNAKNVFQISREYDENIEDYTQHIMYVDNAGNGYIGGWSINSDNISKSTNYSVYDSELDQHKEGTSSLVLSSDENSTYAIKAMYKYKSWFGNNGEKENREDYIEVANDGHLNIAYSAESAEGGQSFGTVSIYGDEISLKGIDNSLHSYEMLINSSGIEIYGTLPNGENGTVISLDRWGNLKCIAIECETINGSTP